VSVTKKLSDIDGLYGRIVNENISLQIGLVYCQKCGRVIQVDSAECLRKGWPKCCGETMSLKMSEIRKNKK